MCGQCEAILVCMCVVSVNRTVRHDNMASMCIDGNHLPVNGSEALHVLPLHIARCVPGNWLVVHLASGNSVPGI